MRFLLRALWALLTGKQTLPVRMIVGPSGLLHLKTGRVMPPLQGADDDDGDDSDDDQDADDADTDDDDTADGDTDDTDDDASDDAGDDDESKLPDNVKAILKKERDARRKAERKARAAERKARQAKPAEDKKPKPKDDTTAADAVTVKIQRANLKAALADEGITGKQAKAAMRLLDGIEYDDDDEPTNLEDVLDEAEEIYGTELIRGSATADDGDDAKSSKRKAPNVNGGSGKQNGKGPRLTAEELKAAQDSGMKPEVYEAMKGVKTLADYEALRKKQAAAAQQ